MVLRCLPPLIGRPKGWVEHTASPILHKDDGHGKSEPSTASQSVFGCGEDPHIVAMSTQRGSPSGLSAPGAIFAVFVRFSAFMSLSQIRMDHCIQEAVR